MCVFHDVFWDAHDILDDRHGNADKYHVLLYKDGGCLGESQEIYRINQKKSAEWIYRSKKIRYIFNSNRIGGHKMKRAGNELLQFLAGLAMLIAGLFIFAQKVTVTSGFFGMGLRIGGFYMSNGLIMVPFIIGIVWMFASGGSFPSKAVTAAGVLIIILAIIMTTNIRLTHVTLYEWALILVLIFGGAGLLARVLFGSGHASKEQPPEDPQISRTKKQMDSIEAELERMKKNQ